MPKFNGKEKRKQLTSWEKLSNVRTLLFVLSAIIVFVFAGFKLGLVDPAIDTKIEKYHENSTNTDFQLLKQMLEQEIENMHERLGDLKEDNEKLESLMNDVLKILSSGENDDPDYDDYQFGYNFNNRTPEARFN